MIAKVSCPKIKIFIVEPLLYHQGTLDSHGGDSEHSNMADNLWPQGTSQV